MDSYKHEKGTFIGSGANEIFFQKWTVDNPKASLVLVHGLGEHSGRYDNIINALAKKYLDKDVYPGPPDETRVTYKIKIAKANVMG